MIPILVLLVLYLINGCLIAMGIDYTKYPFAVKHPYIYTVILVALWGVLCTIINVMRAYKCLKGGTA